MTDASIRLAEHKPAYISDAEWQSRVECAAGHHLLELYGLTDMVEGVLGLRVADDREAYLLKPYRLFFDEVGASDLARLRFDEEPDAGPGRPLNYASCAQVRGVLARRDEVNCVLHTHVPASTVVASIEGGLQPVVQHALIVLNQIAYVDCDIGNDEDAVAEIVAAMATKKIAMIRNHGILIAADSVAETLFLAITLEYACRCQLAASSSAQKVLPFAADQAADLAAAFTGDPNNAGAFDGSLQWAGWLRKLDRMNAGYRL